MVVLFKGSYPNMYAFLKVVNHPFSMDGCIFPYQNHNNMTFGCVYKVK